VHADIAIFLIVFLLGVAAFVCCVIYLLFSLLVGIGRGVGRLFGLDRRHRPGRSVSVRVFETAQRCVVARCGHLENRPGARYCSRCGAPLSRAASRTGGEQRVS
jgi:hypothetical protein